jgi:hypothetical protein
MGEEVAPMANEGRLERVGRRSGGAVDRGSRDALSRRAGRRRPDFVEALVVALLVMDSNEHGRETGFLALQLMAERSEASLTRLSARLSLTLPVETDAGTGSLVGSGSRLAGLRLPGLGGPGGILAQLRRLEFLR